MSKVIIFSREFPKGHRNQGKPTFFVEKILKSFGEETVKIESIAVAKAFEALTNDNPNAFEQRQNLHFARIMSFDAKYHTIRNGNRWKVGDKFSPRVWSGVPYRSKQIIIAPDIEIVKIWQIKMRIIGEDKLWQFYSQNKESTITDIAKNDGLSYSDFADWFKEDFTGQIICWNKNINY